MAGPLCDNLENLFGRYRAPSRELAPSEGERYTNFLGLRSRTDLFPNHPRFSDQSPERLPIPDDGLYGGASEYAALLTAIDASDGRTFTAVELGAGWGPWVSAAGVICKRQRFDRVNLVAVEADVGKVEAMRDHFTHNGLDSLSPRLIHGAAWIEDADLQFPKALALDDYGAGVSAETASIDYRGQEIETETVRGLSLATICADLPDLIDYMHWDIQGAERAVAASAADLLNDRVRHICIGTHSRAIEGALIEQFHGMGWELLWEHPCSFYYDRSKPSLEGMTHTDGDLVWRNPRL